MPAWNLTISRPLTHGATRVRNLYGIAEDILASEVETADPN